MEFRDFIKSILQRANLSPDMMAYLTSEKSLARFRTSFTHKSVALDATDNYELNELIGDTIINAIIIFYIRRRFPRIVNVDWLTRLKNTNVSKEQLATLAEKYGFLRWIKMSDDGPDADISSVRVGSKRGMVNTHIFNSRLCPSKPSTAMLYRPYPGHVDWKPAISPENRDAILFKLFKNTNFKSLLEDTFEAFIGVLQLLVDEYAGSKNPQYTLNVRTEDPELPPVLPGPGFAVCTAIISSFFNEIDISLKYEDVYDAKSRLKQRVYDIKRWKFNMLFRTYVKQGLTCELYDTTVYAYLAGDQSSIPENKVLIAKVTKDSQYGPYGSEMTAAQTALDVLDGKLPLPHADGTPSSEFLADNIQIHVRPTNPYRRTQNI